MSIPFTASLLDGLFDGPELGPLAGHVERLDLGEGAWLDLVPGWARDSDALFERLVTDVAWQADRRTMYDRVVDVPRLVASYGAGDALPDPMLARARDELNDYYALERGLPVEQRFERAGLCFYRTGDDSIAWHGDSVGRAIGRDTVVGILSLGAPRTLAVRSRSTGVTRRFPLGHGDLLVMGGSCQRTHEHAIAKTTKAVGPRISVQFRPVWAA
ncbi:alpha-ketoglutarate-dependent dioxygenase AlkB [Frigoribacterium faeni]|uniref:Alkylated DNA repair dioxygenase AlkB n=1 Tax=Frigoribacterium faeni TaxID=145483 RepID=A0A7W3PI66_9MICO|nr:alpha-ketoglutarate-dependent dioxygenase AlkB [Frigoribacterium faeni]MBA8812369.1 alkylated DNA repair dioxygenase AlkB [Frigoribacterium faeni]BFF13434.1 alpha-ketoglutarate-dependent dioxygenase AlkB [Microbacterium flavescens]GEK81918.1 alkylated DNA repair protein [Frigoribacterium faeni]